VKRAALYMRVSTLDQHPETQFYDLRELARQRGFQIDDRHDQPETMPQSRP
jgi:DNA invertase Pin-like site-specific DNA recombinase